MTSNRKFFHNLYYVPVNVNGKVDADHNISSFNSGIKELHNIICSRLKNKSSTIEIDKETGSKIVKYDLTGYTNYIRIGYDKETNKNYLNPQLKSKLFDNYTTDRNLRWDNNFWYVIKFEDTFKLIKRLSIKPEFSLQVVTKPKYIELRKIFTKNYLNDRIKNVNIYKAHKFPTRLFKHRIFRIVPITQKEYDSYKDIRQPFYLYNKQIIPITTLR